MKILEEFWRYLQSIFHCGSGSCSVRSKLSPLEVLMGVLLVWRAIGIEISCSSFSRLKIVSYFLSLTCLVCYSEFKSVKFKRLVALTAPYSLFKFLLLFELLLSSILKNSLENIFLPDMTNWSLSMFVAFFETS